MKVAIYARVSTTDQDEQLQLVELRRYAAARRWDVVEEFADLGFSGACSSRPALDRLMAAARRRDVDGVLVWRFDRFSRSMADLVNSLEEFRALDVQFISMQGQIDTTTPAGQVLLGMVSAMSQFERSILRERVMAGLSRARERGVRFGRPPKLDAEQIMRLRRSGMSIRAIARSIQVPVSSVGDVVRRNAAAG